MSVKQAAELIKGAHVLSAELDKMSEHAACQTLMLTCAAWAIEHPKHPVSNMLLEFSMDFSKELCRIRLASN